MSSGPRRASIPREGAGRALPVTSTTARPPHDVLRGRPMRKSQISTPRIDANASTTGPTDGPDEQRLLRRVWRKPSGSKIRPSDGEIRARRPRPRRQGVGTVRVNDIIKI